MTYLIGVDLGTTGAKAVLVHADGEILTTSWIEYPMLRPHPAWAENDPEDWVRGVQWLVSQLMATSRVDPASVVAIAIVAQRDPVVLIDGAGEVLTPSISWLDRRDPSETAELYRSIGRARITAISGVVPVPALTLPNLVWTKRHLPDVWRRTRHALPVKDYVIYRLTGEIATDISSLSRSLLNDYRTNTWSTEICGEAGIPIELLAEPRYRPVGATGDSLVDRPPRSSGSPRARSSPPAVATIRARRSARGSPTTATSAPGPAPRAAGGSCRRGPWLTRTDEQTSQPTSCPIALSTR